MIKAISLVLIVVGGLVVCFSSFPFLSYLEPYTYTKEINGVSKSTVFAPTGQLPQRFSQMGGFQSYNYNALTGETINIYYETGKDLLPNSPLFFAIVDDANYATYSVYSMDAVLSHSEYVVSHPSGQQTENWNWTVPYKSNWHFIFDFRQTYREDFYVKLTRYWIGTDYVEATDYRGVTKTLLPFYCSYLGIASLVIGVVIFVYGQVVSKKRVFHDTHPA